MLSWGLVASPAESSPAASVTTVTAAVMSNDRHLQVQVHNSINSLQNRLGSVAEALQEQQLEAATHDCTHTLEVMQQEQQLKAVAHNFDVIQQQQQQRQLTEAAHGCTCTLDAMQQEHAMLHQLTRDLHAALGSIQAECATLQLADHQHDDAQSGQSKHMSCNDNQMEPDNLID